MADGYSEMPRDTTSFQRTPQVNSPERKNKEYQEAKLLRMGVFLGEAQATKTLFDGLYAKPQLTAEEMSGLLADNKHIRHPEVCQQLINELIEARDRVDRANKNLVADLPIKGDPAKKVYWYAMDSKEKERIKNSDGLKLNRALRLNSAYPLAIVLEVEDSGDFYQMNPKYGMYDGYFELLRYEYQTTGNSFPRGDSVLFVAVNGFGEKAVNHEIAHVEQDLVYKALISSGRGELWANYSDRVRKNIEANRLETSYNENSQQAQLSEDWQAVVGYAFEKAKQELLADFAANNGQIQDNLVRLKLRGGTYDSFQFNLVDTKSPVYTKLWEEYELALDKQVATIETIIRAYKKAGLDQRIQLFRWILARLPFEKWSEQLEGSLFIDEAKKIETILHDIPADGTGSPDLERFRNLCQENQDKPLLHLLETFESQRK